MKSGFFRGEEVMLPYTPKAEPVASIEKKPERERRISGTMSLGLLRRLRRLDYLLLCRLHALKGKIPKDMSYLVYDYYKLLYTLYRIDCSEYSGYLTDRDIAERFPLMRVTKQGAILLAGKKIGGLAIN